MGPDPGVGDLAQSWVADLPLGTWSFPGGSSPVGSLLTSVFFEDISYRKVPFLYLLDLRVWQERIGSEQEVMKEKPNPATG